jgi:hypothetical protein
VIKIHKTEIEGGKKEENIFSAGLEGWGYLFSKLRKKPEPQLQQQQQSSVQQQPPKKKLLPEKKGWSI